MTEAEPDNFPESCRMLKAARAKLAAWEPVVRAAISVVYEWERGYSTEVEGNLVRAIDALPPEMRP